MSATAQPAAPADLTARADRDHQTPGRRGLSVAGPHPVLVALMLLGLLVAGALLAWWHVTAADRDLRALLLMDTRLLAQALNVERVMTLAGDATDLDDPNYQRLKHQFAAIANANDQWRFVYLIGRHPTGEFFLHLDSEAPDSPDYSPPGDPYPEASSAWQRLFARGEASVEGPLADRWGTWVSAQVPLFEKGRAGVGGARRGDAEALVARAVAYYQRHGRERLLAALGRRDGRFHHGDLYAFAYDLDMTFLAHPVRPELVGENWRDRPDRAGGIHFRKQIQHTALTAGQGWVDYEYENPATGQIEPKTTFVQRLDDLILCAGAYQNQGRVIAALGVDVHAEDWQRRVLVAAMPAALLTAALCVILLAGARLLRHRAGHHRDAGRWHLLEPLLVLLVGLSLTLYATWGAHAHESASRDWSFSQLATSRSEAIVRTLHDLRDIELEGLASFIETSTAVTTAGFRHYTEYLTRNPAIRAWGFAPRVAAADLGAFEATVRATGATGFSVWQEGADGEREPVTTRADYFPALFVAPSSPVNLQARGFDLGSEPVRRAAIGAALATGLPTTTAPVTFVREPGSPQGLRLFRPVRAGAEPGGPSGAGSAIGTALGNAAGVSDRDGDGAAPDTSQGRGVAVAALRMDALLRTGPPDQATILELDWLEADGTRLPLASTWEALEALPTGPSLVRPLPVFGAVLLLTVRAGPSFLRLHPMRAAWTTALIGLLLTAAGTLVTALLVRRDAGLVGLVNTRTEELRQFFDAGLDMLCIASTDGRFLRLNPEWERTLGYPLKELEGRRFLELVHPDDQAATQAATARVNTQTPLLSFENRYRCRDGSYRWIEWRALPAGQRIFAAARDISERKAAAAQDARRRALERAAAAISVRLATARSAGLDAIFNDTLATLGGLLPADRAYLFRFTADGTRMSNTNEWCAAGIPSMMACNQDHLLAAMPWWQARMQQREPVQITDVAALGPEAAVERAEFMAEGIRSLLCLPMADNRGQVWGFLGFDMVHRQHAWADSDVGLLRLLVQVIGSTIGRLEAFARLRESEATLQRQNRWQELLMSISATYISLPLAQVDAAIGRSLGELASFIGADRAYLFDYLPGPAGAGAGGGEAADRTGDGDAATLRCAQTHEWCADGIAARGDDPAPLPFASIPDWFDAHRQGRTVHLPDLPALPATHPVRALLAPRGVRSVIAVPTLDGEHCLGFVGFECERTTRAWSDTEQRLLSVFAQMLANVRKRRETEDVLRSSRAQAEAASRMKSEFLANMSHEIRTPMNAVVGLSQLLLLTELNDHQRDQLNKIQEASRLLLRIINDILDYSKIEANKLELDREVFAIDTILTQMGTLFGSAAQEQGLELVFQVDADVPHALVGDSLRLGQVLANLLGNAIKFTERGTVAARIRRLAGDDRQVRLLFEVEDTGIGLAAPTLSRLFQPFSQGDNSTTRKYGGTGLGLVISRKLVECMGGTLAVDSRLGEGSRFWFELWLPVAPQTSATPARYHGIAGSRVLVVDDQPAARAVLRDLLTSVRCQVTEADSGTAAVAAVTAAEQAGAPFDYLLLDWQMPGELDGLATVARLHALQEAGTLAVSTAPVIIVSAYHRDDLPANPPAFDRFLGKPVTASALFDTMIEAGGGVPSPRPPPAPTSPPRFTGSHVLLAEDIPVNQLVARGMLERVGIRVTLAHNGAEAVQLATNQHFDLILMDLQMPVMDGFEATRRIRAEQPTLPIIALSAAVMADDREAARAVGMNDHLAKPIDSNALYGAMAQWLPAQAGPTRDPATLVPATAAVPALAPGAGQNSAHRRLLRLFAAQLASDAPPLLAALAARDWDTVQRLTHGLAGAAAIVGAEPLAASANAVNAAIRAPIKTPAPITAAMHEALRTALTDTQAELAALAPAAAGIGTGVAGGADNGVASGFNSGAGSGADAAPADPAALNTLLAALRNSELVDDGLLHSAAALFEARLGHGASAALCATIERFDHDAAADELLALTNRAGLTLSCIDP